MVHGRSSPICRNAEPRPQFGVVEVVFALFTFHALPSCRPPLADCLCLYRKLCLISGWEGIHSVVYTEDKHWRRSVISMLCAGESQIVFLPHHRCVSACCSLTRESLFILNTNGWSFSLYLSLNSDYFLWRNMLDAWKSQRGDKINFHISS